MKIYIIAFYLLLSFQTEAQSEYEIVAINDSIFDDYILFKARDSLNEFLMVIDNNKWDNKIKLHEKVIVYLSERQSFYPRSGNVTYRFENLIIYHYGEKFHLEDIIVIDRMVTR